MNRQETRELYRGVTQAVAEWAASYPNPDQPILAIAGSRTRWFSPNDIASHIERQTRYGRFFLNEIRGLVEEFPELEGVKGAIDWMDTQSTSEVY